MQHFYPSMLQWDKSHYALNFETPTTIYLSKFAMENEHYKEEARFSRIVGDTKDMNEINNYYLKISTGMSQ